MIMSGESSWEPGIWCGEWWPWQDWLAEQWGARSFRFRVLRVGT